MNYWFSSDWHLGHHNILRYDSRPFSSIEEHDEAIISNHNSVVGPRDNFYFLGDFCMFSPTKADDILSRINGRLHFLQGNHDNQQLIKLFEKHGTFLGGLTEIKVNRQRLVLCHYRLEVWNRSHNPDSPSWCIHGHSHHKLPPRKHCIDVGINGANYGYKPISFDQIKELIPV